MKLRFLGKLYSRPQVHLETIPSDYTACYRGQKYQLRVPATSIATSSDRYELSVSVRKYRGVSYVIEHRNPVSPQAKEFCHR